MECPESRRRLVVNADDFGRSASINAAVMRARREGILTTASLMVNGDAAAEAVAMAREDPGLGVGLHLTLVQGRSALPAESIPGLVDGRGQFAHGPVGAGLRYFFNRRLYGAIEAELEAQFGKFRATGLELDHVNGHLHFHLHPVVCGLLVRHRARWGVRRVRLTRDLFFRNLGLASTPWGYRISHGLIFAGLSRRARVMFAAVGIRHTARVFGLLQDGRVDEAYVLGLLDRLPPGDSELYSHPSLDEFSHETHALLSARVRAKVESLGVRLIRYRDLEP